MAGVLVGTLAGASVAAEAPALLLDGTQLDCVVASIDGQGRIELATESGVQQHTLDELVEWGTPRPPRGGAWLVLADGGLLVADVLRADRERLSARTTWGEELSFPLEALRAVVFVPPRAAERGDALLARTRAPADTDRLILTNADELPGHWQGLAGGKLAWETEEGAAQQVPLAQVNVLLLESPPADAVDQRPVAWVGLADGSRLACRGVTLADHQAQLTLAGDVRLKTPAQSADTVVWLQPRSARVTYLSDLEPAGYRHLPFLSLAWPYRLDQCVTGAPLRAAGRQYAKGVGMHSMSRLTFRLEGAYQQFQAEVGVDDGAAPRGSVICRVFVDAQQRAETPILHGGDAPHHVSVDVRGGKTLSLVVDFAERGDEADHADWLNARLVK